MRVTDKIFMYPEDGMLDANTYIVQHDGGSLILIDAGNERQLSRKIREIQHDGLAVRDIAYVLNTHLHLDHFSANTAIQELSGARIMVHPSQNKFWNAMVIELSRSFGMQPVDFRTDGVLEGGSLNGLEFIDAPGHSPDSVCFYEKDTKSLICGDVVFARNTGRVDLLMGDGNQLKQTIGKLSQMDIEYLLPGHMGIVSGKLSVKRNFEFIKENVLEWL